jgi:hypothetical protein
LIRFRILPVKSHLSCRLLRQGLVANCCRADECRSETAAIKVGGGFSCRGSRVGCENGRRNAGGAPAATANKNDAVEFSVATALRAVRKRKGDGSQSRGYRMRRENRDSKFLPRFPRKQKRPVEAGRFELIKRTLLRITASTCRPDH